MDKKSTLILKNKYVPILTVFALGLIFDILFWRKVPGISIAIFVFLIVGAGLFLARYQEVTPARTTLLLLIPIAFFGVMTFIRLENLTTFLNIVAVLVSLILLAHSFQGGKWWRYTYKDHLIGGFMTVVDALLRPITVLTNQPKLEIETVDQPLKKGKPAFAVLRGLLLAFPILLILAAMLAEADPIFEQALGSVLDIFSVDNWGEYLWRLFRLSLIAYLLLGVYLHAYAKNYDAGISKDQGDWMPRFLGFTESAIVLGAVNLLFLSFVIIQFQYFFGGHTNINLEGFTYAEYARRGFSELVSVAVVSLLLFMGLSSITKKASRSQTAFSALGVILLMLVTVILVSSFQRLLLYEEAYGFSRLRTYTHVFIIWLGLLLAAVIILELINKPRFFALAALVAGVGFITTLNVINVDAFIVKQNVSRYQSGEDLDIAYLASLSEDAVPTLHNLYQNADGAEKDALAGAVACHAEIKNQYTYENTDYTSYSWQSFHFSRYLAQKGWENLENSDGDALQVQYRPLEEKESWNAYVVIDGEEIGCLSYWD